jgi:hypothetical protein
MGGGGAEGNHGMLIFLIFDSGEDLKRFVEIKIIELVQSGLNGGIQIGGNMKGIVVSGVEVSANQQS